MSYKSETFLALQCDFPECGELYDDGEFVYWQDGPDMTYAEAHGWLVGTDRETTAYCPAHVREVPCPPELLELQDDGNYTCEWCLDHDTDTHLAPYTTSVADQLDLAMKRITQDADRQLTGIRHRVERELGEDMFGRAIGGAGTLRGRTDLALNDIHRRACLAIRPDLTTREIAMLQKSTA